MNAGQLKRNGLAVRPLDIPKRRTMIVKTLFILVSLPVIFLAIVGSIYLFNIKPTPSMAEHCPRVVRYENGLLVCIVPMQAEDDNLMIVRGE